MRALLGLALTAALAGPALAQVHPQRIPPAEPDLQFAGRFESGEFAFVEASTFGRWQDRGFGWLLVMYAQDPQPIWIRTIVDCASNELTDDYIVWLNGDSLDPTAFSDQGFPMAARTHAAAGRVERVFAEMACSGQPLTIGQHIGGVRAAIDFVQRVADEAG